MPCLVRRLGQLRADVALERRVHDVVVRHLRVPEQEAVAVLGRQHHVLHARGLGDGHPLLRVELRRVELLVEVVVDLDGNRALVRALRIGIGPRPTDLGLLEADRPPVDEHAEPPVGPPLQPFGIRPRQRAGRGFGLASSAFSATPLDNRDGKQQRSQRESFSSESAPFVEERTGGKTKAGENSERPRRISPSIWTTIRSLSHTFYPFPPAPATPGIARRQGRRDLASTPT